MGADYGKDASSNLAMKPRWYVWWRVLAAAIDSVFLTAALVAVAVARFGPEAIANGATPGLSRDFAQAPWLVAVPVWLAVFAAARLYSPQRCQNALEEGRRLITSSLGAAVALVMLGFLFKENPARSWLFGGMVMGTMFVAMGRKTVRAIVNRMRDDGRWMTPTVVVGRIQAKAVVESIVADRSSGILPVASCGFDDPAMPTFGLADVAKAVEATGAGQLLIVAEGLERSEVGRAVEVADDHPINVIVLPGLDHFLLSSLQLVTVIHEPGLALEGRSLHVWQRATKRAIDLSVSGIALALASPLMATITLIVRITSPGAAIFRQKREGLHGQVFEALKFRTMHEGANDRSGRDEPDFAFLAKPEVDPRITTVGRWLRRTSLDELPQLWNVLKGEMSLVGPRPLPLWEGERVGLRRRLMVRPGLTGLWQVSGRSSLSPEERIRLDIVYVQNWSLLLDLSILLRTVPAVIGGSGAY
jgi:exopolysaccharide biosynthesis polyprenyl glycosylphosphotransferase